ncbi:acyl-CoA dehydrogenase family protein [Dictyobacter kobayashii]|uniref:Medium-chain specific acyl-CoA dehydrogenase, mitochondrial n=1 Tax=Dictyobacter kobayashii TaxID=2014872 RepID=A0A402AT97_9CHLR|nr:acyl-CoA dehydrogenase family protein [Dictyobacter kobayashii]GCE22356.1 acyl-CoA dehydrogenase [Dictyobacter kobayashii]
MDFSLTDEQKMVQQTVRDFVKRELMPLEGDVLRNEREGRPGIEPGKIRELQRKAKEMGFWGINTPEEYGGANLGPLMTAVVSMELARTFVPFAFGGNADNILYYCNEEQKQRYLIPTINGERRSCFALTEPGAGSDAANIQMRAIQDGDHWILNGEKVFITNGNEADFAMVFAVTDVEKGAHGGVTCFLVDREMGWRSDYIHTMGEWGPASLYFENVRVPEKNILGKLNGGFNLGMQWIGAGRWAIACRAVGVAERALQMAIDYSHTRVTFGKPIADRQAIQWMIADSHVEIEATRWLALYAAWLAEQKQDNRHASSIAKLHGSNMVNHVVDRVLQIHGGMGYTKELPVERWYREVRLWRIFEGTDEIQRFIISRNLLRGHVKLGEAL